MNREPDRGAASPEAAPPPRLPQEIRKAIDVAILDAISFGVADDDDEEERASQETSERALVSVILSALSAERQHGRVDAELARLGEEYVAQQAAPPPPLDRFEREELGDLRVLANRAEEFMSLVYPPDVWLPDWRPSRDLGPGERAAKRLNAAIAAAAGRGERATPSDEETKR